MHTLINNSPKFIYVILVFLLLTAACRKENVCTLTPEQSPEIRGFRLEMPYEDIIKRFPEICRPYSEEANKMNLFLYFDNKETDCNLKTKGIDEAHLNPEKYSDFNGISSLLLKFSSKRLTEITITYNDSNDNDFKNAFERNSLISLNLAEWSNWESTEKSEVRNSQGGYAYAITNNYKKELLCQKVKIGIYVEKYSPLDDDKKPSRFSPSIRIFETTDTALTEAQKSDLQTQQQQKQNQEQIEQQKKREEEKKKSETFKP